MCRLMSFEYCEDTCARWVGVSLGGGGGDLN